MIGGIPPIILWLWQEPAPSPLSGGAICRAESAQKAPGVPGRGALQSWRAASSTSSAWPFTFTFGQTRAMRPLPSRRKVVRVMPI